MSDHGVAGAGHGHDAGHGNSGHSDLGHGGGHVMGVCDNWFDGMQKSLTSSLQTFSAGIFILITLGMGYGLFFSTMNFNYWTLFIPPILAVLAYYDRTAAVLGIILFLLMLFF
ncbi:MAG: hypothetical protein Q7K42_03945 [Candidatus Diapherotrites archaeon]|nr:hypothetical protein [Candidatus Diapherotrites archaeon]